MTEMRQCRRCEEWLPEDPEHFRPYRSRGRNYFMRACRQCERDIACEWRADYPDRRADSLRSYHDHHPDRIAQRAHRYRLEHLADIRDREARYREVNRERVRERQRLQKRRKRAAEAIVTTATLNG